MDSGACPRGECYIAEKKGTVLTMRVKQFKNNIQTKYMDWVVHGYKFMVSHHTCKMSPVSRAYTWLG